MARKKTKYRDESALNSRISPLRLNSTLVKQAGLTSYYSGGDSYTGPGEIKWDKMFDPMKEVLSDAIKQHHKKSKKAKGKKDKCECKEEIGGLTKTYTGVRNAETGECECQGTGETEGKKEVKEKEDGCTPEQQAVCPDKELDENCNCVDDEGKDCDCENVTYEEGDTCYEECGGKEVDVFDKEDCERRKAAGEKVHWDATTDPNNPQCVKDATVYQKDSVNCTGEDEGKAWNESTETCECPPSMPIYDSVNKKCIEDEGKPDPKCPKGQKWDGEKCVPVEEKGEGDCPACPDGTIPKRVNGKCDCPEPKKKTKKKEANLGPGLRWAGNNKELKEFTKSLSRNTVQTVEGGAFSSTDLHVGQARNFGRWAGYGESTYDVKIKKGKKGAIDVFTTNGELSNKGRTSSFDQVLSITSRDKNGNPQEINLKTVVEKGGTAFSNWNGSMSIPDFRAFYFEQKELVDEIHEILRKSKKEVPGRGKKNIDARINWVAEQLGTTATDNNWRASKHMQALQMYNMGFFQDNGGANIIMQFSGGLSPLEYKSPLNHPAEDSQLEGYKKGLTHYHLKDKDGKIKREWAWRSDTDLADKYKHEKWFTPHPNSPKSPFTRRERGYLNVRKKWMPNQQVQPEIPTEQPMEPGMETAMEPGMETPMGYRSPLRVEEVEMDAMQETSVSEGGETIWDKMMQYGDGIDDQVEKFISHNPYDPNFQKPIETIKNQEWVGAITEWLKNKKEEIINAGKNKDKTLEQKLNTHVNTLIQDVTSYAGKFIEWLERNGGDETTGAKGGSVVSDGSKKDERFAASLAFMGDSNTDFAIDKEGRIGVQSYGLDDIKRVEDLDNSVFARDDSGLATFLEIQEIIHDDAEANRPLNENIIKGQADLLIKQIDSLLSWAHDPLYGQAWIQDFAQANPNEDVSWAMPESDQFDKERLEDEVHGWLVDKLTQSYNNRRPKNEKSVEQIHDETMVSLEKSDVGSSKNIPSELPPISRGATQGSPVAHKKQSLTAKELIAKYS